jgi:DNA-binding transcriptional LysR family regulator
LLGLVSAGFGLTVIARSLTRLHPEELVYRLIDDPRFVSRLWLIHRHAPSPTARAFLDCIAG